MGTFRGIRVCEGLSRGLSLLVDDNPEKFPSRERENISPGNGKWGKSSIQK